LRTGIDLLFALGNGILGTGTGILSMENCHWEWDFSKLELGNGRFGQKLGWEVGSIPQPPLHFRTLSFAHLACNLERRVS